MGVDFPYRNQRFRIWSRQRNLRANRILPRKPSGHSGRNLCQSAASFISSRASPIPRQLPPSPMMVLPIRVEHALGVAVQRPHDADLGERKRPRRASTGSSFRVMPRRRPEKVVNKVADNSSNLRLRAFACWAWGFHHSTWGGL
jgi:hypothetical protein